MLSLPRRHFLPWDRPLLPQAVAFLAADWTGPEPLDLSSTVVVVPTRQSGRRLREALAEFAARRGSAVFPPRVLTPDGLVAAARPAAASREFALLAWADVFRSADLNAYREVFPVDPPARTFAWGLRLAQQFVRLQSALAENGLAITDVAAKVSADFPETERWQQLGDLEVRQRERLARAGVAIGAENQVGAWREGVTRIVALATVDPLATAVAILAEAAAVVPVDVLVFAPSTDAESFDAWGRPIPDAWARRVVNLPEFERRVHLCADPAEQAARVAGLATAYATEAESSATAAGVDGRLALGVADAEILPLLLGQLSRGGVTAFNPEGRLRREGGLYHLLVALAEFGRSPSFETVTTLARSPDVLAFLEAKQGNGFSSAGFLAGLDDLRRQHLPADLASALDHAAGMIAKALASLAELRQTLRRGAFSTAVAEVLRTLFEHRRLELGRAVDAQWHDDASAWTQVLRDCAVAAKAFPEIAGTDAWELALELFGGARRTEEKPAGALDLQGWLELLFEDAPHLVVAGFNDGFVPEAVGEDPFLPESLRARLGLRTNAARFARDAYLLQALAASRAERGRLDLVFGKTSAAGDPLRPSRLLLRCEDAELPRRIAWLFRAPRPAESHVAWTRAWPLHPRVVAAPPQVAVTALRRWLACRFRFYLKYALRMEAVDAAKSEMDAFDFGTLCHAAFEAMGREPALRDCADASVLRDFLLGELTRRTRERFGGELSLPLLIQVESARQRLGKLAEVQARIRSEGWVIQAVEQPFSVAVSGLTVRGKIDRIDRHETTGAVRVVDYKTSDAGVSPQAAHVRPVRAAEMLPDWAQVTLGGKTRAWVDLQLPLYRHALAPEWGDAIACGYINLPKAVGQTALVVWDDYSREVQESALRCAEAVCAAIRAGEFWPPSEDVRAENDEFAPLFHRGVAESVEWEAGNA